MRCNYEIDELDLSVRVYNVLLRAGITTVSLLNELNDKKLFGEIEGLSSKGIAEIQEKLKSYNSGLRDCPFCGGKNICIIDESEPEHPEFAVCCDMTEGGCGATSGYRRTKEEAIEAWNRRN